jgi:hypothetical protein
MAAPPHAVMAGDALKFVKVLQPGVNLDAIAS